MSPPVAVVSMSGGKDSVATALVAIEQYGRDRVRIVHADTGNEHPLTERYVRDYLPSALGVPVEIVQADFTAEIARKRAYVLSHWPGKGVPDDVCRAALAVLVVTGNPFLDLCVMKGRFPSRMAQFCTQELKGKPLDAYTMTLARLGPVESWQGVRRDESLNRRNALDWEQADQGWMIHRPIAAWSAADTFALMAQHGITPNPLYSMGMKRVGCMPCINCGKDELLEIAQRWPDQIARIRRWEAMVAQVSKRGIASFFFMLATHGTAEEYADANAIDQAVAWAATSHGGKQFDLLRAIPSPECSSAYGLCE